MPPLGLAENALVVSPAARDGSVHLHPNVRTFSVVSRNAAERAPVSSSVGALHVSGMGIECMRCRPRDMCARILWRTQHTLRIEHLMIRRCYAKRMVHLMSRCCYATG